jgi:predicted nucleic acid-binding Zn ribbon protein
VSDDESGIDLAKALLARVTADARSGRLAARGGSGQAGSRFGRRRPADTSRSGAGPDDRDPQLLASSVERLGTERGWQVPLAVAGVTARWAEIVGPELATHCVPDTYTDGSLTVRADSTAWATQVRLLASTLVRRLNDELGASTVTRITVLGPSGPSWRKGKFRVKGRGPRDTYG